MLLQSSILYATTADELLAIHKVTTNEMNSIATPQAGSLVYNTTENAIFFYTGTAWKRMRPTGAETVVNAGNATILSGSGTTTSSYVIGI